MTTLKYPIQYDKVVGSYEAKVVTCPVHGETQHSIVSTIKGHEGAWCQICWLESLGPRLPVQTKQIPFEGTDK